MPREFLPGYGSDWFPGLGFDEEQARLMALDPMRAGELGEAILGQIYKPGHAGRSWGGPGTGQFGEYLRSQMPAIGQMLNMFDTLNIAGGSAARTGGTYRTFEDMVESLYAGKGADFPGRFSISDWRNMLYGGEGAAQPGGLLGESAEAAKLGNVSTEAGAKSYMENYIAPLMGSTIGGGRWAMLMEMLPELHRRWRLETKGGLVGSNWAQWLQQGGYLPSMIGR